jgi:hypothetical protein
MIVQGVLTVVTEIESDRVEALRALLAELDSALDGEGGVPLVDFRDVESVHFARFVVLPKNAAGKRHLAFSVAYDGPKHRHLEELAKRAGPGLSVVYGHCVGFGSRETGAAELVRYLEAHDVPYGALHIGYVGRSLLDVRREEALRRFIGGALDDAKISTLPSKGRSAQAIRREIIRIVANSDYRWALEARECPTGPSGVEGWWKSPLGAGLLLLALIVSVVVAISLAQGLHWLGFLVAVVALFVLALRFHETHEPAKTDTDVKKGLENAEDEDFGITNQLTHVAEIKPGHFRKLLLRAVLFAIEVRARLEFYKGDLGGIETIHCAHWAILDEATPRLLFCSNYDGSWERYLGDFIEEAGAGMTGVWSNTVNYPESEFLLFQGAKNERVFKAWTRENQVRTDVWYRAEPAISCRNLNDNSRLRDGLRGYMSEADARDWLRLV